MQFFILIVAVGLDGKDFFVKQPFNKTLEFFKLLEDFIFVLKKVDPCELAEIIIKTNIIFIPSNKITSQPPYIRKD
jgi:hypothetical protein